MHPFFLQNKCEVFLIENIFWIKVRGRGTQNVINCKKSFKTICDYDILCRNIFKKI